MVKNYFLHVFAGMVPLERLASLYPTQEYRNLQQAIITGLRI